MKHILALLLLAAPIARSAVIYSGLQNLAVPLTFDGVYLDIETGATTTFPATWGSAAWINPFFGGMDIATSALLRPVITGADQVVNLAPGTGISGASNFALGANGSTTHAGAASNQFQIGTPGFMGFAFESTTGGPTHFGWLQLTVSNTGTGTIQDWAYDDVAGAAIQAGAGAVPEPGRAMLMLAGLCAAGMRRRR